MSTSYPTRISTQLLAEHEAAHAVMRVLLLGVATKTWIVPEEGGFSEGTEFGISLESRLWILLAGFCWESRGKPISLFFNRAYDIDEASALLRWFPFLRYRVSKRTNKAYDVSVERALNHHIRLVWSVLHAYQTAIQQLASMLVAENEVSAEVALQVVSKCSPLQISDPEILRVLSARHHMSPRLWCSPYAAFAP